MSWTCRLIEFTPDLDENTLKIGDMFFASSAVLDPSKEAEDALDWPDWVAAHFKLSDYYKQNNSSRLPLLVWLPGRVLFSIDGKCFSGAQGYYGGWTVSGAPPNITVQPSINIGGTYHGWLQNGVLSDDCEGRKYDDLGRVLRVPHL